MSLDTHSSYDVAKSADASLGAPSATDTPTVVRPAWLDGWSETWPINHSGDRRALISRDLADESKFAPDEKRFGVAGTVRLVRQRGELPSSDSTVLGDGGSQTITWRVAVNREKNGGSSTAGRDMGTVHGSVELTFRQLGSERVAEVLVGTRALERSAELDDRLAEFVLDRARTGGADVLYVTVEPGNATDGSARAAFAKLGFEAVKGRELATSLVHYAGLAVQDADRDLRTRSLPGSADTIGSRLALALEDLAVERLRAMGQPPAVFVGWKRLSASTHESPLQDIHGKSVGAYEPGRLEIGGNTDAVMSALATASVSDWLALNNTVPGSRLGEFLLAYATWTPRLRLTDDSIDASVFDTDARLGIVDVLVAGDAL